MTDLLESVLDAHGGLAPWNAFSKVAATIVTGGEFWAIKGVQQDNSPRHMVAALHYEWASLHPYGAKDQRTSFTPDRIAIEKLDGEVLAERRDPRESLAGHEFRTAWDPLQRAYFNGYALWTYLTCPFAFALPGFSAREIDPVVDNGNMWRGLQVTYPPSFASHSAAQEFYFGEDGLLRRHDYRVDIAGSFPAVHYVEDFVEVDGLKVPTRRRAYRADADGMPVLDAVMVSIDLSEISFG